MKRKSFLFIFLLSLFYSVSAKNNGFRIVYQRSFNNQVDSTSNTILEIAGPNSRITSLKTESDKTDPVQTIYLNYDNNTEIKTASLKDNQSIYTIRDFKLNDGLEPQSEKEKIAGYLCKKAVAIINSNRIEIWYTDALGVKGTMQPNVGIPDGLVLKVVRNGQQVEQAIKIEKVNIDNIKPDLSGEKLDVPTYSYTVQQSKVISVDVFTNQSIYFRNIPQPKVLDNEKVMQFANGSIVLRKVKLPEDSRNYSIFTELSQYSEGDAYDRTGVIFMIPENKDKSFLDGLMNGKDTLPFYKDVHGNTYEGITANESYQPPVELMRFFTSFGVRGYNHIQVANYNWPDSVIFKQDVTDYASLLKGEVWIGAWIGNYAENGHNITLKIKYYPSETLTEKEVYPLFTTTNILEMAGQAYPEALFRNDSLTVDFVVNSDLKNAQIRYISTGHGGWGEGDEFTPKLNQIFIDGERVMACTPWREDCGSYRELNPASGNFSNGLSSSDLSRSGWCPGTVSNPLSIYLGDLKAGKHQIKVAIPVGNPSGSSKSYWCISGVLVGEEN